MPVTTYHDIREDQIAAIVAITPTSLADVKFRAVEEDADDFRDMAEAQPQGCLRWVSINSLSEQLDSPMLDAVQTMVTAEIVVAYPADGRYGTPKKRMLEKVMREDHKAIESAAGILGYSSIGPDATVIAPVPFMTERRGKVVFLVYEYTVAFNKDV